LKKRNLSIASLKMWGLFLFLPFPIVRLCQAFEIGFIEIIWNKNDSLPKEPASFFLNAIQGSKLFEPRFFFFLGK